MAYSASIRIRTDYRVKGPDGRSLPSACRRNGTSALYLQVIIEGVVKPLPLQLDWPPEHFDKAAGRCLPRHADDKECEDTNLICQQALADANDVFTEFRLRRQPVTLDGFLREFRNVLSREDLVEYFAAKLTQRHQDGLISTETFKSQRSSLRTLRRYSSRLPFASLADQRFPAKFEGWMVKQGYAATTRWNQHKQVRTYLRQARQDNIWFPDPYANYKVNKPRKGNWRPLFQRDVLLLDAYYHTLEPGSPRRRVLQRWLFSLGSCGLRISDQVRIVQDWRFHNLLIFVPWKNRKSGRRVTIELSARALELWDDALREREPGSRYVFTTLSGQKANEHLHAIEEELGLSISLHNHIARHTFATLFLEGGGQLHMLKEYMGHSTIQSTMIYVETTPNSHHDAAQRVDGIFGERPEQAATPPVRRVWMRR